MNRRARQRAEREKARDAARLADAYRTLAGFVRYMWPILHPTTPLAWGWHIDLICAELEKVARGEVLRLVIMIPPGCMKSLLTTVFFPAWLWLHNASKSFFCLSNDIDLIKRDSKRCRDLVESDRYRELVALLRHVEESVVTGEAAVPFALEEDQNEKLYFQNTRKGFRQCRIYTAKVTGKRTDIQIVDDPHDSQEARKGGAAHVAKVMKEARETFDIDLSTRLNNRKTGARIVIAQALAKGDLVSTLAEREGWRVVCLPMKYEPDHPYAHPDDPRTEPGELLFEALYDEEDVAELERDLGAVNAAAQLQQRPTVLEGVRFRVGWFRVYEGNPEQRAKLCSEVWISVDAGRKPGTSRSSELRSNNCIQVWGFDGAASYLLDEIVGVWEYNDLEAEFLAVYRKWRRVVAGRLTAVIIEDHANGTVLIQRQRRKIRGLRAFDPQRDTPGKDKSKAGRAKYSEAAAKAGQIFVPDPERYEFADEFITEHVAFGAGGVKNDRVDTASQVQLLRFEDDVRDPVARTSSQFAAFKG